MHSTKCYTVTMSNNGNGNSNLMKLEMKTLYRLFFLGFITLGLTCIVGILS